MAGVGVVQFLAKWAVDRPRPNLGPWGFPSAHVLSLVVLCGYLAYVVSVERRRRGRARLAVGVCAAVVGTVAYSRMYLDAHFLSDILGGFTAGFAYLCTALWVIRSAPPLAHVLRMAPLATGADPLLVPAMAGSSADSLVAAAAAVAMTPATPVSDTPLDCPSPGHGPASLGLHAVPLAVGTGLRARGGVPPGSLGVTRLRPRRSS